MSAHMVLTSWQQTRHSGYVRMVVPPLKHLLSYSFCWELVRKCVNLTYRQLVLRQHSAWVCSLRSLRSLRFFAFLCVSLRFFAFFVEFVASPWFLDSYQCAITSANFDITIVHLFMYIKQHFESLNIYNLLYCQLMKFIPLSNEWIFMGEYGNSDCELWISWKTGRKEIKWETFRTPRVAKVI